MGRYIQSAACAVSALAFLALGAVNQDGTLAMAGVIVLVRARKPWPALGQ